MSCRVLGMEVEEFVVGEAVKLLRNGQTADIIATIKETPDNTPVGMFIYAQALKKLPLKGV